MTVVYRYEKGLRGDDSDVWGWSCSNTVGEVQDLFEGVVDFRGLCRVQVGCLSLAFLNWRQQMKRRVCMIMRKGLKLAGSSLTLRKGLVGYVHELTFFFSHLGKLLDRLHHRVCRTSRLRPGSVHHQTEAARAEAGPHR